VPRPLRIDSLSAVGLKLGPVTAAAAEAATTRSGSDPTTGRPGAPIEPSAAPP